MAELTEAPTRMNETALNTMVTATRILGEGGGVEGHRRADGGSDQDERDSAEHDGHRHSDTDGEGGEASAEGQTIAGWYTVIVHYQSTAL